MPQNLVKILTHLGQSIINVLLNFSFYKKLKQLMAKSQ